jgi:hypothetical protein
LGYLFLAETKRLWELEQHKEDLTIVHTSMALHTIYTVNGMDQVGLAYLMHAVNLAKKLGIFSPSEGEGGRYQRASDFTAWALFRGQA